MKFNFALPKAQYKQHYLQGPNGPVEILKRERTSTPRRTKGNRGRRIIKTAVHNGIEYNYHATKGWRSTRA